jgi:uncharacterized protein YgbK (DUF1537 family)
VVCLADDLTGASDCGVAPARAGLASRILLDPARLSPQIQATAIDMRTRGLSPDEAAARMEAVLRAHGGLPGAILYQKLDSLMRGNWAFELASLRRALAAAFPGARAPLAIVAPAFPETGRVTREGVVWVGAQRIEAFDPARNAAEGDIAGQLGRAGVRALVVPIATLRAGTTRVIEIIEAARERFEGVVFDAEEPSDLERVAEVGLGVEGPTLWAGSGGLIRHLAGRLGAVRTAPVRPVPEGPIVIAVGSRSPIARAQLARLEMSGRARLVRLPAGPASEADARSPAASALCEALAGGTPVAVGIESDEAGGAERPELSEMLASVLAPHLRMAGALVMTGGETARRILDRAGLDVLVPIGEIEPGTTLALTVEPGYGRAIIMKAGAFGDADTLVRSVDFLTGSASPG